MDPFSIAGLGLMGLSGLFGAFNQNSINKRNLRAMMERQRLIDSRATDMMSSGPGAGEQLLMQWLTGTDFDQSATPGEGFNAGQDALMQMLRSDPIDTTQLFASWEPLESRLLDQSLDNFWGTAGGLGERFGTAAARETGRIRGEAADNAIARRAETSVGLAESNANRQQAAAGSLQEAGLQLMQLMQAANAARMGGFQALIGAEQGRGALNAQLLSLMAGAGIPQQQPNAFAGFGNDFGQLMFMLPMFKQIMGEG